MSRGLGNEQKVLGLLGWGWWGDSRGRRAWDLEVTSVLPQLPAIGKTCVTPKGVFCVHFSIFQVDRPAPSCLRRWVGALTWPSRACCLAGPQQGAGGGRAALMPGTGECHWGPAGAGGSGLTAGVGTALLPAPRYLNTIHRYGREQWDLKPVTGHEDL